MLRQTLNKTIMFKDFVKVYYCCQQHGCQNSSIFAIRLLPAFATVMRRAIKKHTVQTPATGSTTVVNKPEKCPRRKNKNKKSGGGNIKYCQNKKED